MTLSISIEVAVAGASFGVEAVYIRASVYGVRSEVLGKVRFVGLTELRGLHGIPEWLMPSFIVALRVRGCQESGLYEISVRTCLRFAVC